MCCFFFLYVSAKFHLYPSSGDLPRPRIGMLSLVTVSPEITVFHSCCLSHHVFDQVNLWPAWVGFETAILWQCSPGTVETQRLYPLRHGPRNVVKEETIQKLPRLGQKVHSKSKKKLINFQIKKPHLKMIPSTQFSSIWPIGRTLPGTTTPNRARNNDNEVVLHIPRSYSITEALLSDRLVSYPGHSLEESHPSEEFQSVYSASPMDKLT